MTSEWTEKHIVKFTYCVYLDKVVQFRHLWSRQRIGAPELMWGEAATVDEFHLVCFF